MINYIKLNKCDYSLSLELNVRKISMLNLLQILYSYKKQNILHQKFFLAIEVKFDDYRKY